MTGHRFNPEHAHKLDNPERRKVLPPEQILQDFGIGEDDVVLDVGAGTGYFSIPAARMTRAEVYALDVEPQMLQILNEKIKAEQVSGILPMEAKMEEIPLPDGYVDKVIASLILHETGDLSNTLDEFFRVMKQGGRALIIDWEKREMDQGPPLHARLDVRELISALESTGFEIDTTRHIENKYYLLHIHKD